MLSGMFTVSPTDAALIRSAFNDRGELSAAIELRRLFPGIGDNVEARRMARAIAGWKPLPLLQPRRVTRLQTPSPADPVTILGRTVID